MKTHVPFTRIMLVVCAGLLAGAVARAEQEAAEPAVYDKLPVKEVTVFKDGHAYVLHEGALSTDAKGNVLLDTLPSPVMGTFWAYSARPEVALSSVVSSRDMLDVEQVSLSIEDLIKGNIGKTILIKESYKNETYQATILRVLEEPTAPSSLVSSQAQNRIVLLKAPDGTRALPVNQIQAITFLDEVNDTVRRKQQKDTLTLQLDWKGRQPEPKAAVGMAYVQRGVRWIPSYRVEIDGKGKAILKLQAYIINELADLNDVKMHLVVGVPAFAFQDVLDPISFQGITASLSGYFRTDNRTANAFSNAIMSQSVSSIENRAVSAAEIVNLNQGADQEGTAQSEDLFVFTVDQITLKKGQRMVMPLAEFTLAYEDVYWLDLAFAPPLELSRNFNNDRQMQLAKMFHAPSAVHKIRLTNTSDSPLTTAPATILKDGRVLAQGMMTYTAIGNKGDIKLTTAVNIGVKNANEQIGQTPNAAKWNNNSLSKIDMRGAVTLTNFSDKPVSLAVRRSVLGTMTEGSHDAVIKQLGNSYDGIVLEDGQPVWWNWCNWPSWWFQLNSIGQAEWTVELAPGQTITLDYHWHYFWG